METRYFDPDELFKYFTQDKISPDLIEGNTLARCSVADLIELGEAHKKGNLAISLDRFLKQFDSFIENLVNTGVVFIADLDQEVLSKMVFTGRNPSKLWTDAATKDISPLHSLRRLTLNSDEWGFWEKHIYIEMEDYFNGRF